LLTCICVEKVEKLNKCLKEISTAVDLGVLVSGVQLNNLFSILSYEGVEDIVNEDFSQGSRGTVKGRVYPLGLRGRRLLISWIRLHA